MTNHSKFVSASLGLISLALLFSALNSLSTALAIYNGPKYQFLAENWGTPLAVLLTLLFGLGWWFGNIVENLILRYDRKIALFACFGFVLAYGLIGLSSIRFAPGFLQFVLSASSNIIFSGFFFRFSVIHPEVLAKLRGHN